MVVNQCPAHFDLRCLLEEHHAEPFHVDNHDGGPVHWNDDAPPRACASAGAWIIYDWDMNAYPISLHPNELDARRKSDELGYGRVKFWAWGEWENR